MTRRTSLLHALPYEREERFSNPLEDDIAGQGNHELHALHLEEVVHDRISEASIESYANHGT